MCWGKKNTASIKVTLSPPLKAARIAAPEKLLSDTGDVGAELPFSPSRGMNLGQVSGLTGIPVCATPAELFAWGNVQRPQGRGGSAAPPARPFPSSAGSCSCVYLPLSAA